MAKKTSAQGKMIMAWFYDVDFANKPLPLTTGLNLQYTVTAIDPETKDDALGQTIDPDSDRWNLTIEAQLPDDDLATYAKCKEYVEDCTDVPVIIAPVASTQDYESEVPEAGWKPSSNCVWGNVLINNVSINGQKGNKATLSVQMTGHGELNIGTTAMSADMKTAFGFTTSES